MSNRIDKKATAREKAAQSRVTQQGTKRRRRVLIAVAAVGVVVAVVAGLVITKVAGDGTPKPTASGQTSSRVLDASARCRPPPASAGGSRCIAWG